MAIDGTPPLHLPPGAQPIILNDLDLYTAAQQTGGAGPYVVPVGKRLVLTSAAWNLVETAAGAGPREYLVQVDAIENDGHPPAASLIVHTVIGLVLPATNGSYATLTLPNLAIPIRNPNALRIAATGGITPAAVVLSVLHLEGYLENVPA